MTGALIWLLLIYSMFLFGLGDWLHKKVIEFFKVDRTNPDRAFQWLDSILYLSFIALIMVGGWYLWNLLGFDLRLSLPF